MAFDKLEPNKKYSFVNRAKISNNAWPLVVPKKDPSPPNLPDIVTRLVNSTWKSSEPAAGKVRSGNYMIGSRGQDMTDIKVQTYNPQARPTGVQISTFHLTDTAIASDWHLFDDIERTNCVSFRADKRDPTLVLGAHDGFHPPSSRSDRYYLENNIYDEFQSYLARRSNGTRNLTKQEFLNAVDKTAHTKEAQQLLVDYMMWRKIMEGEAVHLGRMVENECLKGYISTSRALDSSLYFAAKGGTDGWIYIVVVRGGFVIPYTAGKVVNWGTKEAEIAQWGPIPRDRIVGFRKTVGNVPTGPIYMSPEFRKKEKKAAEFMVDALSGMLPTSNIWK